MTQADNPSTIDTMQVAAAFQALKVAFQADPTYAWEWQCALAESQRVAGVDPKPAHQGAAHFMLKHFAVNITAMAEYRDLMRTWH
jgi:hypothetical protein